MEELIIDINHVSKMYKLYDRPRDRMMEALHLSKKKKYTEYYALSDINLQVYKGQTVGLIGTNGAGKSTLLKIVTGVLTPTQGSIQVNGKIAALLELGAGFNMEYTGIENIYLNGSIMGYTKEQMDERVQNIIEFADIGDYVYQPVKMYSSGMFARLAFAVAINVDPDVLIVDEALSVGDIYFQAKCFHRMDELKRNGTTILLVTHDMGSVAKYCDKVAVLKQGMMIKQGEPKAMVDIYKRILVNQYDENEPDGGTASNSSVDKNMEQALNDSIHSNENDLELDESGWKSQMGFAKEKLVYGDGRAQIIDFGIFDDKGLLTNTIMKKSDCTIKMKVKFMKDVKNPIFAYTIKNNRGEEITGTNSMYEKQDIALARTGEVYEISFSQRMLLQGGEYLLSFGCTGFDDGEFVAFHRLYDITSLTIVSEQDTVGRFDSDSIVTVSLQS